MKANLNNYFHIASNCLDFMESTPFRSECPISSALDLIGDRWSLLIIRDLMFAQKSSFKDFANAPEKMASNILSDRLSKLESVGLILKRKDLTDKKKYIYSLSLSGIDLLPILVEIILWSDTHLPHISEDMRVLAAKVKPDKDNFIRNYKKVLYTRWEQADIATAHNETEA